MNIRQADPTFNDVNGFGSSPDGLGATVRFAGPNEWLGADEAVPNGGGVMLESAASPARKAFVVAYGLAGIAGAALGAYHGYKRNDSVGWAIAWSLLGSIAPVIVIPVAYAQGIGKRKGRSRE